MSVWKLKGRDQLVAPAWGGQLVARRRGDGKWEVVWSSGDGELTITAHTHYLDRFGLDQAQLLGAGSGEERLALLAQGVSVNGPSAILDHLRNHNFEDRLAPYVEDSGPDPWWGPDPF